MQACKLACKQSIYVTLRVERASRVCDLVEVLCCEYNPLASLFWHQLQHAAHHNGLI